MKPTAADIGIVIGKIEAGDWLDPSEKPISWSCVLYDLEGVRAGDGDAHTAREAMALAWVHAHAPDALIINHVAFGEVPYDVPDNYVTSPPSENASDLADFHQRQGHAPRFARKGREIALGRCRIFTGYNFYAMIAERPLQTFVSSHPA